MNKQDLILEIKKRALLKIAQSYAVDPKDIPYGTGHETDPSLDNTKSDGSFKDYHEAPVYVSPANMPVGKLQAAIKNFSSIIDKSEHDFKQFAADQLSGTETHNSIGSLIDVGPTIVIDAKWGPITNKALSYCAAVGDILVQLANDYPVSHKYSFDSEGFKSLLTEEAPDSKTASELAPKLIEFVNHLATFYKNYSFEFLKNPEYKKYIKGGHPLFKIKPAVKDLGTLPEGYSDPKVYGPKALKNVVLPSPSGNKNIPFVNLYYIDTLEHLKALMKDKLGYSPEQMTAQAIKAVFNALQAHVDNESSKIPMTAPTASSGTVKTDSQQTPVANVTPISNVGK